MTAIPGLPTDSGLPKRLGDFPTLADALDYAAGGRGGFAFHSARGALLEAASWTAMRERALEVAGRLRGRGLEPGDRVSILAETGARFVETLMGCFYAGLCPCPAPLPGAFGTRMAYLEQLRAQVDCAGARAVVAPGMFGDWLGEAFEDGGLVFSGPLSALDNAPEPVSPARPAPGDLAYIQFSSGTTRAPKGVAVSHAAMMANIRAIAVHALGVGEGDRGVGWLPWYHDMGLVGKVMLPMACQVSVDFLSTRDFMVRPGLWLDLISRSRATISYAPSFGYELAARRARPGPDLDLSCWRVAGIGGDMVRADALSDFATAFAPAGFRPEALVPSYGMAEATLGLAFAPLGPGVRIDRVDADRLLGQGEARPPAPGARVRALASCGPPLPGHEIAIRDESGATVPDRRVGRLFARGPSLMQGYFGDSAETARALSPDGWLDTGDLGYRREGELVITGRAKDMLIVHGRNIWPQDVEWSVESHVEGARTGGVAVFGAARSADGLDDDRIALVLECRFTDTERRDALRAAAYAAVRELHGIEVDVALCPPRALPRTTSGKLRRNQAREMFLAGELDR